ncbi:hypothetical protein FOA43_001574 [Brettanomyces nanus]|uniref:Uncharacterized protein n=1 Tax=Eeniella nana TaxID=13502 RepID=A0A875S363_EENNA|nr:uncharacterized protein FOA43_001574 [Brettanomyces nanus]QPG74249.1 hypothetical protein FOA43_001574 [Brettanomyces nanus]
MAEKPVTTIIRNLPVDTYLPETKASSAVFTQYPSMVSTMDVSISSPRDKSSSEEQLALRANVTHLEHYSGTDSSASSPSSVKRQKLEPSNDGAFMPTATTDPSEVIDLTAGSAGSSDDSYDDVEGQPSQKILDDQVINTSVYPQSNHNSTTTTTTTRNNNDDNDDVVIVGEVKLSDDVDSQGYSNYEISRREELNLPNQGRPPIHHSHSLYPSSKYQREDEINHNIPYELSAKKLRQDYGHVVDVTQGLIDKATQLYEQANESVNTLSLQLMKFKRTLRAHTMENQMRIQNIDLLILDMRKKNRGMMNDTQLLRHNKHELQREWRYKLGMRDSLIENGHLLPAYKRPPARDMRRVNLGVFQSNFHHLQHRLMHLNETTHIEELLSQVKNEDRSYRGSYNNIRALGETAGSAYMDRTADNSVSEPQIVSVREITNIGNATDSIPRPNDFRRPDWWNDDVFKSLDNDVSTADSYQRNQLQEEDAMRFASNPYLYNSNVYQSDEADSLRKLLNNIKPDEDFEEGMETTPKGMLVPLLKHQRIGLAWMKSQEKSQSRGGILADDMGLGKTVQTLAIMLLNRSEKTGCKTNLIVAPVSLLQQWAQEVRLKVSGESDFKCYVYHQSKRAKSFEELQKYDIVLVSYNTLASEWKKHYALAISELRRKKSADIPKDGGETYRSPFFTSDANFYRIILDEAQNVKNKLTNASRCVATLRGDFKWCLSGTPIQNRIEELYPLLRFLQIQPYCNETRFKTQIAAPLKTGWQNDRAYKKLHALLSAILLRRTKDSEIDGKPILELPEKHIIKDEVLMTDKESDFYKNLESESAKKAQTLMNSNNHSEGSNVSNYSSILTLLLRMRQACDHYYLVKISEDKQRTAKMEDIRGQFKSCKTFKPNVIARVDNERENELTCQMCHDVLPEENAYMLSECGHIVCRDCIVPFFDENSDTSWDGDRSAKCLLCRTPNLESASVSFAVYDATLKEKLNWQQMRKKFGLENKASDKNYRAEKIKELIREDGGKIMVSAKVAKCIELVKQILEDDPNEKIIIFSQFTTFFDILQIILYANGISYLRYDGTMDVDTKNKTVSQFYNDSSKRILLLSLKAGNVGLTLTCANHVILLEPFWNPYVERQAQDRVHRISQTREVFVHRILVRGTVEDRIMELQEKKEKVVETALDPKGRQSVNKLSMPELRYLFGLNGLPQAA